MRGATLTQELGYVDVLNYQTLTNAGLNSTGFYFRNFTRVIYTIATPSMGAAGTLNAQLQSCQYSGFNSAVHNVPSTAITQLLTASTPGNNAITTIEVSSQAVQNANPGDAYVRLNLVGGGNALTLFAVGQGGQSNQLPASQWNVNNTYLGQQVVVA